MIITVIYDAKTNRMLSIWIKTVHSEGKLYDLNLEFGFIQMNTPP